MMQINVRGTYVVSHACVPFLTERGGHILTLSPPIECTGNCFIDDEILRGEGVTDFSPYLYTGEEEDLALDLFL